MVVTLPATSSAGLPVVWSFDGSPGNGASLTGNQLTATNAVTLLVRAQNPGDAQYAPLDFSRTLRFVDGPIWWETPAVAPGTPPWFTLVEGSPYGLSMTARIVAPHTAPVPVPALPDGVVATPSVIPAGQTSVACQLSLPANLLLVNRSGQVKTGDSTPLDITLFLANRANIPLDVFVPARVPSGISTAVEVSSPGVPAGTLYGPPPDLSLRSFTVSAVDFDHPETSIPVTLDSASSGTGPYPRDEHLQVTFPPVNARARLTVTTDDGISGSFGPIQIDTVPVTDTNADDDGINDILEAALQRTPDHFDQPPLTVESDAAGLHAVLGSRPLDLKGWTVVIELSTDLQTWTPAAAAATTLTPNADGTTERVSVLLPAGAAPHFVRLRAEHP